MTMIDVPEVLCIGPPRLTAGLDRRPRLDLAAHQAVFGPMPRVPAERLIELAAQVDLRGRGGAAFPVAAKLSAVLDSCRRHKRAPVIVVNGAESEPGSAKDRALLLRSPNLVLAGALAAAWALQAKEIVVGVTDADVAESVRHAAAAEPALRQLIRVFALPDRFVSGTAGALVSALSGRAALPPGQRPHASAGGVDGRPTLLSNAETFAQLAVLVMAGPEGYAAAGLAAEPGTVLLTVGGAAARPAVVEVPTGLPLGDVLDLCGVQPADGLLVGGYHGAWLAAGPSYSVPVSRAGLATAGGTLGPGVVLALDDGTCPLGEVARVAGYLAAESAGQCGPCQLGLPGIARALTALADGSGGADALERARRAAAAVRGRGACAHPDGVFQFVLTALDVFDGDVATHAFRGGCGRPVRGCLPVPPPGATRLDQAAPARPARTAAGTRPGRAAGKPPRASSDTVIDLAVSEEWIAEITGTRSPADAGP
jgi:NADH:ubiquinone oxidoreductase subunit F (NADH-binding)